MLDLYHLSYMMVEKLEEDSSTLRSAEPSPEMPSSVTLVLIVCSETSQLIVFCITWQSCISLSSFFESLTKLLWEMMESI